QDAFRWATSRSPTDQELQPLKKLLEEDQAYYQTHPDQADRLIESANGLPQLESFPPVQLATWTSVCRAILNLHETVNRN
ncbi:MAG: hypothetical protein MI861_17980, partial [Pirellulales bacterium]|nr:hypothetical protein [Pirellulales bacterium]